MSRGSLLLLLALWTGSPAFAQEPAPPPLWFEGGKLQPQAGRVLAALRDAEAYGLRSRDYELPLAAGEVEAVLAGRAEAPARDRFEAALTAVASRFVRELHGGRISPGRAGFHLPGAEAPFDAAAALRRLASSRDVAAELAASEPKPVPYRRLKAALAVYRALAARPDLTALPPLPARSVGEGEGYPGAPQLRRLLVALGDLASAAAAPPAEEDRTLDPALIAAVRRFQGRHGLEADGALGPRTFAALTTPLSERVAQLELALERWRWLSAVGRPDIVVNIPQFVLLALPREGNAPDEVLEMRVIVGETEPRTRTPVFASRITQVVFQPFWDVPRDILTRELLPRIRADRSFLDRHGMEIVRGGGDDARRVDPGAAALDALAAGTLRLRQRPGPKNALGAVKFVMPNPFSVYLHSTPEKALFERTQRTFSHGCIRLSDPHALAKYVLRDGPGVWDDVGLEAALCGKQTFRVTLERPVPVVVFYATAAATRSEGVLFFQDVYGHDRLLLRRLDEHTAQMRRAASRPP